MAKKKKKKMSYSKASSVSGSRVKARSTVRAARKAKRSKPVGKG